MSYSEDSSQHIAVIGMAGRFPQAANIEEFWLNIEQGIECITFFSNQEALASGVDPELLYNPNYVKAFGVLENIEIFDAHFFGFSPREALWMDPQQRLFLECAWEALEQAGYDPKRYKGRIGVYASASSNSYLTASYPEGAKINPLDEFQVVLGSQEDFLATHVSYKLNLKGPSIVVKTACSSSLVATHLAIQSLLNFESDMVLAGGVSISVPQKYGYLYQEGHILSPDGHCRAFDTKAKGTVGGSGIGVILLKRLAEALKDEDTIYAIIRGSAINNDGSAKIGYTAPSIDGQAAVIAEALEVADIEPETVSYIETHGTGTTLGDPIEIAALSQVFQAKTIKKNFCAIGSVKTNIGHLDAAAGIAGLIKTILALKHKVLPPSLHFTEPNPNIDFANSPFFVNTQAVPWQAIEHPRRAGVSSFGIGGTNAHVLLEEAPARTQTHPSARQHILMLSAKTEAALNAATDNLIAYLRHRPELSLSDIAYTLQVGRQTFDYRRFLVCANLDEVAALSGVRNSQHVYTARCNTQNPSLVFMFPGVGTQYPDMGKGLYETEVTFREEVDHCLKLLQFLGVDLRDALYPDHSDLEGAGQRLQQSSLALPAIFTIEYALAKLWMSWGVYPQAMIGHSFGEYASACLSGVMSLEDALSMVVLRGRLMDTLPKGAMLAVPLPADEIEPLLSEELSLAVVNGPALCVVSGPVEAIDAFEKTLHAKTIETRRIHIDSAYHSSMVTPILGEFKSFIEKLSLHAPTIPYISNITGTWITATEATNPDYWTQHLRQTVRFAEGMQELLHKPSRVFLEVGPGHGLSSLVRLQMDVNQRQRVVSSLRHPQDRMQDTIFLLHALGNLWLQGVDIDWQGFHAHDHPQRIVLPTYPFERQRYWLDSRTQADQVKKHQSMEAKASNIASWLYASSWKQCPLPASLNGDNVNSEAYWLVFAGTTNVDLQIIEHIEQWGQRIIKVTGGKQFCKYGEEIYAINLQERSDYVVLFDELLSQNKLPPAKVLYLQSIDLSSSREAIQDFSSLFVLFSLLEKMQQNNPVEVIIIFSKSLVLTDEDLSYAELKAPLLGLCNSFSLLSAKNVYRVIDVALPPEGSWQEKRLINRLLAELSQSTTDRVTAYRGDRRWNQTAESLSHMSAVAQRKVSKLRQQGTYLIYGGFEDIGFQFARYIAQNVHATFLLLENASFPANDQWDQWLAIHDEDDKISSKIRRIRLMQEAGAEVRAFNINTRDYHWQTELLDIFQQYGEIDGILYQDTLAIDSQGEQGELQLQELLQHLQLRSRQLITLERAVENVSLDFCFLSFVSPTTENAAQAINAMVVARQIEAFVQQHNSMHSRAWMGIHWDISCLEEARLDLSSPNAAPEEPVLSPQLINEVFQQLLAIEGVPLVTVSAKAPYTRLKYVAQSSDVEAQSAQLSAQEFSSSIATLSPGNEIEATLAHIWKELLGVERLHRNDNFFLLGGHSLLAAQLNARLRETFLLDIPLRCIFDNPTIAELAAAIEELFLETVAQLSEDEAQQLLNNNFSENL
ncbi:MAG TPA: beta-ketoacyl synthase N-terminal-like domain-containing protein [Ktedonobacteraceae bacterium]|nr:beta-ketoacyl synthase N-terminal-like domain-containing protein [Ktedonobacteraceae bacterium]